MKSKHNRLSCLNLIALAVFTATAGTSYAASDSWSSLTAGNWNTFTNWASTTQYPNATGNIATLSLDLAAQCSITLTSNITVGGLVFNDPTLTGSQSSLSTQGFKLLVGGNNLTLDTGSVGYNASDLVLISVPATNKVGHRIETTGAGRLVLTDNVEVNIGTNVEYSWESATLSGAGNLKLTGSGQLMLASNNVTGGYTGNIRIEGGTLQVRSTPTAFGSGTVTWVNAAGLSTNNYAYNSGNSFTPPTFTNNLVLEKNTGSSTSFGIYAINSPYNWSGNISSVNTAAGDGASLSVNYSIGWTNYNSGKAFNMSTLSGDNSGLKFDSTHGFTTTNCYFGVGSATALGLGNATLVTLGADQTTQTGILATTSGLTIASSIKVAGNTNQAAVVLGSSSGVTSGTTTYTGPITLNYNSQNNLRQGFLRAETGSDVVFTSAIGADATYGAYLPLTKIGGGRVELNTANTYMSNTAARSGELVLGNATALGGASNATTVNLGESTPVMTSVRVATIGNDATGTWTADATYNGTYTGSPTAIDGITLVAGDRILVKDAGLKNGIYVVQTPTTTWVRASDLYTTAQMAYGQQVSVTSGTVNGGSVYFQAQRGISAYPGTPTLNSSPMDFHKDIANPNVAILNNGVTISRNIAVVANGSTGKSTLGGINSSGTSTFSGGIALNRNLTVSSVSGGTVALTGTITNSGSYTITHEGTGTLALNGANAATSITSNAGTTLQGTGTLAGSLTANGTLAPGYTSIGTLTAASATLGSGSSFNVRADGTTTTSDCLAVSGALVLGGTALNVNVTSTLVGPSYIIATYGSLSGNFTSTTGIPSGYYLDYNYHGLNQIAIYKPSANDTWNVDANGNWSAITSWLSGNNYPNDAGTIATFGYNITAARTVSLTVPTLVGGIVFNDTNGTGQAVTSNYGYQLYLGANNLVLDGGTFGYHSGDLVVISVPATDAVGNYIYATTGKLVLTDNVQFDVIGSASNVEMSLGANASNVGLLSGAGNILKTGQSQLLISGENPTYSGNIRVAEGLLQVRSGATAFGTGTLTVTNGSSNAMSAGVSFNNYYYPSWPTFANNYVWEQTAGVTSALSPFYVINSNINWAGNISSVNAAAGDGASLSVNATLTSYGRSYIMTNLTGNNTGLKFDSTHGFVAYQYLGVGSANALGTGNVAYVQLNTNSYVQNGLLATAPVSIASKIDFLNSSNSPSGVIGANISSGTATFSGLITLNSNNSANTRQALLRSETGSTVVFNSSSVIASGSSNGTYAPVTKVGGGNMEIDGANTYLSSTAVRSGQLVVGNANAFGGSGNTTTISLGDQTTTLTAVRVASIGNENYGTYSAGTVTGAATSIDGVTLAAGDRVLLKDNTAAWKNGVYVVSTPTTTWVRDSALDSVAEELHGVQVSVTAGSQNIGKSYFLTQSATTLDSSILDWHQDVVNPDVSILSNGVSINRNINVVANGSTGKSTLGGSSTTSASTFSGTVALSKNLSVTAASGGPVTFSGAMTGSNNVTKEGLGTVKFTTAKAYTGTTSVTAGTLEVDDTLASSAVTVASGTTLQGTGTLSGTLSVTGTLSPGLVAGNTLHAGATTLTGHLAVQVDDTLSTELISSGVINLTGGTVDVSVGGGGFTQPYYVIASGSSITGALPSVNSTYKLTNTGTQLQLSLNNSFTSWIAGYTVSDSTPAGNPSHDGISNLMKYALGLDPTKSTQPAGTHSGTTLTFTKGDMAKGDSNIAYSIQESTDLVTWGAPTLGSVTYGDTITYNYPTSGTTKVFARLKVVQTP